MSILIADSGSTKTEWILINKEGEKEYYHTDGLNPYFMTLEQLIKVIDEGAGFGECENRSIFMELVVELQIVKK